jgi:hypothetical protein
MAKKIIQHGQRIDNLHSLILTALEDCKKEEARLTKAGVQIGSIHFKTDRPNSMYILEPTNEAGRRPYIHVGVDPRKQDDARIKVERWKKRDELRRSMADLETELKHLMYEIEHVARMTESVHEHASMVIDRHIKRVK